MVEESPPLVVELEEVVVSSVGVPEDEEEDSGEGDSVVPGSELVEPSVLLSTAGPQAVVIQSRAARRAGRRGMGG